MSLYMPRGVVVAGLGKRFIALIVDSLIPAVAIGGAALVMSLNPAPILQVIGVGIAAIVLIGYCLYQWWAYGTKTAGLGFQATGLRLVSASDGLTLGWGRFLLRQVVLYLLLGSVVGGIAMCVFLVIQERRQGWHDLAAGSIVVEPTPEPPEAAAPRIPSEFERPRVGLVSRPVTPAEVEAYAPRTPPSPRPGWMPGLDEHPVNRSENATPAAPVNQGWIPLPTPSSVIEPSDATRIAPAGARQWYLLLDDGREVGLAVPVLLGRNPRKSSDDPELQLVPAGGDGRMISRTHVFIAADEHGVYVVDRGSTNGTAVVTRSGIDPCPSEARVRVGRGARVSYGDRWFTVLRRESPTP
ncbi:MAG: RDD family protein [Arachnia sp.]